MLRKVLQTIRRFEMFEPGDFVAVGFSGGADSAALLELLWELRQELHIRVSAVHINHNLRGEEAQRDERFCRDFCAERGILFSSFCIDAKEGAKQSGKSVEEYSREQRYRILEEQVASFGQRGKIATAHHENDQAETVLFYLARGTGLHGAAGIPPGRGRIVRPLIECSREEIEDFCKKREIDFVTDSSNLSDDYTRNRIRHSLIPMMCQLNSAAVKNIARFAQSAREDDDFLQQTAQKEWHRILLSESPVRIDRQEFLLLHPAVQKRILFLLMQKAGLCPDSQTAQRMAQRIKAAEGKTELKRGIALVADQTGITLDTEVFYREERQPYFEQPFREGKTELFPGKTVQVTLCSGQEYKLFFKKDATILKNALDCDKMRNIAVFRQRKEGDRISLYYKKGSRLLKKMWTDAKLPQKQRWESVILSDEDGVVWVEGFGCDRRVMPDGNSDRIALIQIRRT